MSRTIRREVSGPVLIWLLPFTVLCLVVGLGWWWVAGRPDGTGAVVMITLPVLVLVGVIGMVSRRVVEAGPDGIAVTVQPWTWTVVRASRGEVASIHIRRHDEPGTLGTHRQISPEDPSTCWTVVVRTVDGREILVVDGTDYWDEARRLADEFAEALGPPSVTITDPPTP